jgi:hypothetical protein
MRSTLSADSQPAQKQKAKRKKAKARKAAPAAPVRVLTYDDETYTLAEWRQLRRISPSTERRLRAKGLGPKLVHLSDTRLGVTVKSDREWIEAGGASASAAE